MGIEPSDPYLRSCMLKISLLGGANGQENYLNMILVGVKHKPQKT
jgi:hypothetical protein